MIEDDAIRESTLKYAGIERARAIILCTQNDSLNLQIALKARSLNPKIRVIIRIFDEDFARILHEQYDFSNERYLYGSSCFRLGCGWGGYFHPNRR